MDVTFILTDHAKKRLNDRIIPDPNTVKVRKATPKDIKENNFHRKLKPNKVAYLYREDHDYYLYICVQMCDYIIVLTAYTYTNDFNKTGNRKKK